MRCPGIRVRARGILGEPPSGIRISQRKGTHDDKLQEKNTRTVENSPKKTSLRVEGLAILLPGRPRDPVERRMPTTGNGTVPSPQEGVLGLPRYGPTRGPNFKADPGGKALISKISPGTASSRLPPGHLVLLEHSGGTAQSRRRGCGGGGVGVGEGLTSIQGEPRLRTLLPAVVEATLLVPPAASVATAQR